MGQIDYWRWPGVRITLGWVMVGMTVLLKLIQVFEHWDSAGLSFVAETLFEGAVIVVLLLAYIAWEYSRLRRKSPGAPSATK